MKQMDVFKKIGGILQELNDQYNYLKAESSDLNELELELFVANAQFLKDHAEILRKMHERATPAPAKPEPIIAPTPVAEKPKPATNNTVKKEPLYERSFFEPVVQQKPIVETKLELTKEAEPPVSAPYNPVKIETPDIVEPIEEPIAIIELESEKDTFSFEQEEPETAPEELALDEVPEPEPEVKKPKPVVVFEPVVEKPAPQPEVFKPMVTKPETVKDLSDKILTFNQKISAQIAEKENMASSHVNILPITDLKSAINLNDKLLYIKDLFNGYSLAYSEAIEIVNRFNTYEEAERFLKTNYVAKNNWEGKAATAEKFYTLLKRRYPTV
jgi:hypothetical protein